MLIRMRSPYNLDSEDLLEVAGIWISLERADHKYVNNFGLAWQAIKNGIL